jgi:chloramphenicol-sensitive protein RarD
VFPVQHRERRGLQAALVAFSLWGLLTIYWKQLTHLPAFEMIGWRVATATVLMLVVAGVRGRLGLIRAALADRPTLRRIVLAAALLTANWTTYVWAIGADRVVETALGYFLAPLGTIAIGTLLLGERLSPLQRLSVGSGLVAVGVLTVSYGELPWVALVLGVTWSWYGLIKRGVPLGPTESLTSELLVVGVPAAVVAASGFFRDGGVPDVASGVDWVLVAGTGVTTAVPLVLFAYAAPRVPFTLLGPANYLVPIIHFLLGWLAYDEDMPASRFVGFGFVWLALTLVTVDRLRAERPRAVLAAEAEPVTP